MSPDDPTAAETVPPDVMRVADHIAQAAGAEGVLVMSLGADTAPSPAADRVSASVVVCPDAFRVPSSWAPEIERLRLLAEQAVATLVTAPGPAADGFTPERLERVLAEADLPPTFFGYCAEGEDRRQMTVLAIAERSSDRRHEPAPAGFRATAIVLAFNEADVIEYALRSLLNEGLDIHLIDNWSTDETVKCARSLNASERLTIEIFPPEGPSETFDWERLLRRVEEVARHRGGWAMVQDADEIRRTPWRDVCLRDGLWHAQRRGFNAVDFTSLVFAPVDDTFTGGDFERQIRHFEFGARPGHFLQIKAWNADFGDAVIHTSGGHEAQFPGRRVFPYKFLQKHYPIRSQSHGERKVFRERVARWNADERAKGWHTHYDRFSPGARFLRSPDALLLWDQDFATRYLTERLTGVGIPREVPGRSGQDDDPGDRQGSAAR